MAEITNFVEAQAALRQFYGKQPVGSYTLDTMRVLMEYLGDPQDSFKVIHVAGTSGKTSTAYFITSLLGQAGFKTGLTVSPHVDEVNERVQINIIPLPEVEFCGELSEFLELIATSDLKPSYFEVMVAFAYWEFARQNVDYAVVEVGLGGLFDGTNVVTRADKVCVITDIGLDHIEILGDTLAKIAFQKAGIILSGNEVYMNDQAMEVMDVVDEVCTTKNAELHTLIDQEYQYIDDLPLFQQRNFRLADEVVAAELRRNGAEPLSSKELLAAAEVYIPARMEIVKRGDKTIIIDGAHNEQKLQTLFESIHAKFPNVPIAGLIGFVEGDRFRLEHGLEVLRTELKHMVVTSFYSEKDYPKQSVDPQVILDLCEAEDWHEAEVIADPAAALEAILLRPEELIVITGSFYLLNHVRPLLLKGNS